VKLGVSSEHVNRGDYDRDNLDNGAIDGDEEEHREEFGGDVEHDRGAHGEVGKAEGGDREVRDTNEEESGWHDDIDYELDEILEEDSSMKWVIVLGLLMIIGGVALLLFIRREEDSMNYEDNLVYDYGRGW